MKILFHACINSFSDQIAIIKMLCQVQSQRECQGLMWVCLAGDKELDCYIVGTEVW